ncbi:hypothetical protein LDENG_00181050, partial [Lucifuga dentata]
KFEKWFGSNVTYIWEVVYIGLKREKLPACSFNLNNTVTLAGKTLYLPQMKNYTVIKGPYHPFCMFEPNTFNFRCLLIFTPTHFSNSRRTFPSPLTVFKGPYHPFRMFEPNIISDNHFPKHTTGTVN